MYLYWPVAQRKRLGNLCICSGLGSAVRSILFEIWVLDPPIQYTVFCIGVLESPILYMPDTQYYWSVSGRIWLYGIWIWI
jgi:hypothetical protein